MYCPNQVGKRVTKTIIRERDLYDRNNYPVNTHANETRRPVLRVYFLSGTRKVTCRTEVPARLRIFGQDKKRTDYFDFSFIKDIPRPVL